MTTVTSSPQSYTEFIEQLGTLVRAHSEGPFAFPGSLREDATSVLIRLVLEPLELRKYLDALSTVAKGSSWNERPFGPAVGARLLDDDVVRQGLSVVSDAELAAALCNPGRLSLFKSIIREELEEGTLGPYWDRAIAKAGADTFPGLASQLYEEHRAEIEALSPHAEPRVPKGWLDSRSPLRLIALGTGVAVAASLLVALSLAIGRGTAEREVALAARVAGTHDPARGPDTVAGVSVENTSSRTAYLTVVGLSPSRRPAVHYLEQDRFIAVGPGQSRTVRNLPTQFDGCPVALVVLTPTPAGEVVRKLSEEPVPPDQAEAFRERLKAGLEELGYRGVGIITVRIEK